MSRFQFGFVDLSEFMPDPVVGQIKSPSGKNNGIGYLKIRIDRDPAVGSFKSQVKRIDRIIQLIDPVIK